MFVSRVILKNWRNFRFADARLGQRAFLIGPNACGKSNFLDLFRFLRDIVKPQGGGLQSALKIRGGLSKIRCLNARQPSYVEIEVYLSDHSNEQILWKYAIGITQESRGHRQTSLKYEKVWNKDTLLLDRPDLHDKEDKERLTRTHLEQINANKEFRDISKFFEAVSYLHLVPQFIRHPEFFSSSGIPEDPFGQSLMERIIKTPEKTRKTRLKKIEEALRIAVPKLKDLTDTKDEMGIPHLEAVYQHWRPNAGRQREDQFSDGTLRLIGLLWALSELEKDSLLLLEEPELSLNAGIIQKLPALMYRLQRKIKRQTIISTHSSDLLMDESIGGEEVLLMTPGGQATEICLASGKEEIRDLLEGGMSAAEAILPLTNPPNVSQLGIF